MRARRAWVMAARRSGASDEATRDDDLRQRVRRALARGALFLVDRKSRVGRGSGRLCAVCTSAVSETDVEYEVRGDATGIAAAHLPCYLVWRQESEGWRVRADRGAG
jgi:hypothetical protein